MVNNSRDLDDVFHALSDPTRRRMVARLTRGPASIGDLGQPFAISKPAVTKHIKILERAGLLERHREGRVHQCRLVTHSLKQAEVWIETQREFWEASPARLQSLVEDHPAKEKT